MTRWPPRGRPARIRAATAAWFSPRRWSANDMIIAAAALVLAVSVFVPWFKATVRIKGSSASGFLIDPPGTVSGIAVHGWLWAVFALALLQFAVLAVRYVPARRALKLRGYRQLLVVTSGLSCIAVLLAFAMRPGPWYGPIDLGGTFYVVIDPSYGAIVAVGAAIVSLGVAIAAIRDKAAR